MSASRVTRSLAFFTNQRPISLSATASPMSRAAGDDLAACVERAFLLLKAGYFRFVGSDLLFERLFHGVCLSAEGGFICSLPLKKNRSWPMERTSLSGLSVSENHDKCAIHVACATHCGPCLRLDKTGAQR